MPKNTLRRVLTGSFAMAVVAPALMFGGAQNASASVGSSIIGIAEQNLGDSGCGTNSAGGSGYYSSCGESWCADFAKWVWAQDGVDVSGLTPAAGSFGQYGSGLHSTPRVGDAAVFNYNGNGYADHVSLVASVNSDGTVGTIGGNQSGGLVTRGTISAGGYYGSQHVSGYVTPNGGRDTGSTGTNVQVDIVGGDSGMYSQYGNYSAGHFNNSWTNVGGSALTKITSASANSDLVHFYAVSNGHVYGRDHIPSTNTWTNWGELPGGAAGVKDIAVSMVNNHAYISIVGGDGTLYYQDGDYNAGHFNTNWTKVNGVGLTNITSTTAGNTVHVYGIANGLVYGEDFDAPTGTWGNWGSIPGGASGAKDITAATSN